MADGHINNKEEQAGGKAARPEKVRNVYGSTAGASSSTFHVYRSARRAERDRLEHLDAEHEERMKDEEFQRRRLQREAEDKAKTEKNAAKRKKRKLQKRNSKKTNEESVLDGAPNPEQSIDGEFKNID